MNDLRFALVAACLLGCSGSTGPGVVDSGAPVVLDGSPAHLDEADAAIDAELADAADAGGVTDAQPQPDAHVTPDVDVPDSAACVPIGKGAACGSPVAFATNRCGDYYQCTSGCAVNTPDGSDNPACTTDHGVAGWRYSCTSLADRPSACTPITKEISCCPIPKSGVPFVG